MLDTRDRYLPVRKDDILSALAEQRAFADPAGGERFRRLCEMLAAIYHYEYFEMLERLRSDYYYFNPQVAQHAAIDPERSKPWRPWHPLTRAAQEAVGPGQIEEYRIEILSTGNLFKAGHRICLDIASLDLPSGLAGAHDVEYAPYHICSSKTVVHKIYHDEQHPSHLMLPIIPLG